MKKFFSVLLCCIISLSLLLTSSGCNNANGQETEREGIMQFAVSSTKQNNEVEQMKKTRAEYESFVNHLENFPINFVYDDVYYSGFHPAYFEEISRTVSYERNGEKTVILLKRELLTVTVEAVYYENYNAYDYTVHFANESNRNSGVLRQLNAVDMHFEGADPIQKGIWGDALRHYRPYEIDLSKENSDWVSKDSSRATDVYFPYFNLEHENGGAMIAIGWGGTWEAHFKYDKNAESTHFTGTGTVGMNTYIKPGESIRTPLIAVVRYYERDEDLATNAWRKWVVDCNYPKDNAESDLPVQPVHNVMVQLDTGKPNSDGSISEDHTTWKRTLDTYYSHGLTADYRWFDAGWYTDPYGQTVVSDWWGTVGTWELDKQKWPGESFKEAVDYAHDNGSKFLLWFEAERVTHLDGLADNFGYDREWALSDHGDNNAYLNNLGNEDCLNWVYNRIISMMEKYGVDLYREDMNMDCLLLWQIGDAYQGVNRVGITENLYMQGHYELWDRIIEWCGQNGRSTYVDSCAAGGRRNDLETLRRGVPFNRSDVDRSTVCFRLGITWSLTKWFPFTGAFAKDVPMNDSVFASKTTEGDHDIYALRGTYVPSMTYLGRWYHDEDMIDWDTLKQGLKEWEYISKYFYKEYYTLTPYAYVTDDTVWTSFMYFDKESDSGVIQAFRQPNCADDRVTVKVKGVNPDNYYEVRDLDRVNTIARVKGSQLMEGLTLYAKNPRTAIVIYLNPVA